MSAIKADLDRLSKRVDGLNATMSELTPSMKTLSDDLNRIFGGIRDRRWVAHPKRERFHLHFTSTSSSWLNLVERWFRELTDKRLRRSSFGSVNALVEAIETWAEHWNDEPKPFVWHKTAQEIIEKVR